MCEQHTLHQLFNVTAMKNFHYLAFKQLFYYEIVNSWFLNFLKITSSSGYCWITCSSCFFHFIHVDSCTLAGLSSLSCYSINALKWSVICSMKVSTSVLGNPSIGSVQHCFMLMWCQVADLFLLLILFLSCIFKFIF